MKKSPLAVGCLLLTALLISSTGCTTKEKTAAQQAEEDEYVTVTVTGSNIPKRVRKSDIAAGKVAKDEQMQLMDKDEFARSMRPGAPKSN
jgi:hypothetical protein